MFNSFYSLLAIATISLGLLSCKKENDQPPPIPLSSGRVVEYGSRVPLAGVMFRHGDCKKYGTLGCKEWVVTATATSDSNGYLTIPAPALSRPLSFVLPGYWDYRENDNGNIGPGPENDLPSIQFNSIGGGSMNFEVQLFPQVPISLHLVNTRLDPDSANSALFVSAILDDGQIRSSFFPFFLARVTDTTVGLMGYGNVYNEIQVSRANGNTVVLDDKRFIKKGDTVNIEVNY